MGHLLKINFSLRRRQEAFLRQLAAGIEEDLSLSEAFALVIAQARTNVPVMPFAAGRVIPKHLTISPEDLLFVDQEARAHGLTRSAAARRLIDAAMSA